MPGTVLLLAASPVGKGCLVDAASVLPVLAAVPPPVLAGTDTANVVELADPLEPQAVLTRLRAAAATTGPLTVFVTGQLQLDRRQHLPHLALARTTPSTVRYTGFAWHWFREELRLRPAGSTTVVADLHADAETWGWLRGHVLECGPTVAVYGRVAPPPGRRSVAAPTYMKAVATILRSGGRPAVEQLHQLALARIAGEGEVADLLLSGWTGAGGVAAGPGPGFASGYAPAPASGYAPAPASVPASASATGPGAASGAASGAAPGFASGPALGSGSGPAFGSVPGAALGSASESVLGSVSAPALGSASESVLGSASAPALGSASAPAIGSVPESARRPAPGTPSGSAPAPTSGSVPGSVDGPASGTPSGSAPAPTSGSARGSVSEPVPGAPSGPVSGPAPEIAPGLAPVGAPAGAPGGASRDASADVAEGGSGSAPAAPSLSRPLGAAAPRPPLPVPDGSSPRTSPEGTQPDGPVGGSPGPVDTDPHVAISTAVQSGRHASADAIAARLEQAAVVSSGVGSEAALHWAEVRADLAMFAGDAERSCRTWMAVAASRLAAGQAVDAPAVEAAVDRAHHQWGRIGDTARARELGPALAELRGRVPGRRRGALDHVQRQLRRLQILT